MERTATQIPYEFNNLSWIYPSVEVLVLYKIQHKSVTLPDLFMLPYYEIMLAIHSSINFEGDYESPKYVRFEFKNEEFEGIESYLLKKLVILFDKERLNSEK